MKRIPENRWFVLHRLGREVFSELMRARVEYESRFGFKITSATNIPSALEILSHALGEPVLLQSSCFICERPFVDEDREGAIICHECLVSEEAYALYTIKFAKLMDSE